VKVSDAYHVERDPTYCEDYSLLRGPDGFECLLTEPEDRSWYRDGREAIKRLNEQHETIATLRRELAEAKSRASLFAEELEHDNSDYKWQAEQANAKIAAMTLDNARKDAALRDISKRLHYPDVKSDDGPVATYNYMCGLMAIADAALAAAPADSLGETIEAMTDAITSRNLTEFATAGEALAHADAPSAASLSLDNARLRKLADRAVYAYLDDEKASYKVVDSAMTDLRAALASSPDAMVERARKYMSHDKYCDKMFGRPTGCTCGLDALIASLGGKV